MELPIVGQDSSVLLLTFRQAPMSQCGNTANSLTCCYLAVVMELPDSLWMNCKSEFGVIFLRCSGSGSGSG